MIQTQIHLRPQYVRQIARLQHHSVGFYGGFFKPFSILQFEVWAEFGGFILFSLETFNKWHHATILNTHTYIAYVQCTPGHAKAVKLSRRSRKHAAYVNLESFILSQKSLKSMPGSTNSNVRVLLSYLLKCSNNLGVLLKVGSQEKYSDC